MRGHEMNNQNPSDIPIPNFWVNVAKLPKLGHTIKLSIDDRDIRDVNIKALVGHLDVLSVENLSAKLLFRPWARDGVQVEGEIMSSLHTQCPVTLEAVAQDISATIKAKFVPSTSKLAIPQVNEEGEMILEVDGEDQPDIFEGEEIDAWSIVLEYLILEIDFFARAEGAEFPEFSPPEPEDEVKSSPFAKLQSLKK
jgi:uncharacterized metal-binding protein YceD (DUF177 family)